MLERFLLEGFGSLRVFSFQLLGGRIHLIDGGLQVFRQLFDHLVLARQTTARHALQNRRGLVGKFRLVGSDGVDVVFPLLLFELILVVDELVRGCDDFLLPARKRFGRVVLIASTASAATLLALPVFAAERPDFDKIDVGRNRICGVPRVDSLSVIGHQVTGLQIVLLEEERMPGRYLFRMFALAGEQVDLLFGTAVYGVIKFKLAHAEIIFGPQFSENFFDFCRFGVAPGFCEFDDRFLIIERFHGIFFQAEILRPISIGQLNAKCRRAINGDTAGNGFLTVRLQRYALAIGKNQTAG